eukprot:PLAT4082.2.p1 GENE.PLAT4082.2~~PLAT4082.2.p1  ORF type:complete len:301 (+),score=75.45 PLAT4082.2:45-905(+)
MWSALGSSGAPAKRPPRGRAGRGSGLSDEAAKRCKQLAAKLSTEIGEATIVADGRGTHAEYVIEVEKTSRWVTQHRYSSFSALHKKLKKLYPSEELPDLPRRGLLRNLDSDYIRSRGIKLDAYLVQLLENETLSKAPIVRAFLMGELPSEDAEDFIDVEGDAPDTEWASGKAVEAAVASSGVAAGGKLDDEDDDATPLSLRRFCRWEDDELMAKLSGEQQLSFARYRSAVDLLTAMRSGTVLVKLPTGTEVPLLVDRDSAPLPRGGTPPKWCALAGSTVINGHAVL